MDKIPAKIAGILSFVCKIPVTKPATMPQAIASPIDKTGLRPVVIVAATIHPPKANVPSTVISGISKTLNVIYTPIAIIPQTNPKERASGIFLKILIRRSIIYSFARTFLLLRAALRPPSKCNMGK